jgi:spore germination protein GerM
MQEPRSRRPFPLGLFAGFGLLLLTTVGTTAWWSWRSASTTSVAPTPPAAESSPAATVPAAVPTAQASAPAAAAPASGNAPGSTLVPASGQASAPKTYWVKDGSSNVALVPNSLAISAQSPSQKVETALNALLAGPKQEGVTTTIPKDTKLRSVQVKPDGIHVDLSQDFVTGGGSASMTTRVGQVLYTVTSEDPTAPVWFSVEGKPVDKLGGEGLVLDGPLTRQEFEKDFPQ